ncbi:MAG: ThiF family adenylyltransferase [Chloroflexi bacterium]|nr:ThiF family adenylyltransferase [Chloroflexota bacterium]
MSQRLINRSADLKRLQDEGYDVEIRSGYLLLKDVPYVNGTREVKFGILVSELTLAGDVTARPGNHVARFIGSHPCNKDGSEIAKIKHNSQEERLAADLVVHHSFSSKPPGGYKDYHDKMTTYAAIIASPAQAIDPTVTPRTFPVIEAGEDESVFNYIDTASSRAGITMVTKRLEIGKVGIVGLGGSGAYVLDFVAKTPVREIHLFDGDAFLQHNAFRSPGAPSIEELRERPSKVASWKKRYSAMRRGIIAHEGYIDGANVDELRSMEFVFLCLDRGEAKKLIVEVLGDAGISFIDVGMGVYLAGESLGGVLRVTTSTAAKRDHVRGKSRIPFADGDGNNEYSQNIQIADLNALNAALAVVRWKKLCGFYADLEKEHHSTYTIDGDIIINDDQA